jgi:hypothetical protein
MKNYLLIRFEASTKEMEKIFSKLYENLVQGLEKIGCKAEEDLEDPDGYLIVEGNDKKFGITTPVFETDPVVCGIYLEQSPGKELDDDDIRNSVNPIIETAVEKLPLKLSKVWFATFDAMINEIKNG